jgi:glycine/D-amino acid oxidase-like deaminating enzyme/nitrite reductase/ring-hydroxylating ferredoxin subunit
MTSLWLDTTARIETDPFQPDAAYDVVVVGAGITGITTALLLARAGKRVAVLEARQVGAVTTGNTTAKISLLQHKQASRILRHHSQEVARAYFEANLEGQSWLLRYCGDNFIPFQRRDAYTYAVTDSGHGALEDELEALHRCNLQAEFTTDTELPFDVTGAIRLPDQAQFNPMDYLTAAVAELRSRGGIVVENLRVRHVDAGTPVGVRTDLGRVTGAELVLATGTPILNRGGHFALLKPGRSYGMAFKTELLSDRHALPQGMYLSIDSPGRTLRTYPANVVEHPGEGEGAGGAEDTGPAAPAPEYLIVGGNGHPVGRHAHTRGLLEDIERWTHQHFPGAEATHEWSAQDYQPAGALPYVGPIPVPSATGRSGRIHVATGFHKWGMTNGVAAALALSADILGGDNEWAKILYKGRVSPQDALSTAETNAEVAVELLSGWLGGLARTHDVHPPEGQGVVTREKARPVGVCTVDGATHRVSAICTHLGGVLGWNDAERSWDCPLHGSRFSAEGELLEGPATRNLERP